ncbi:unnamed protein product [Lactuca saligna]|uniref:Uncharacterized protein n=1 Tax=Lactuca saligna TaxID=75948 RepID=A0AA36E2C4_LACSI|nr:unnamed protein product [Lactuca saligna]
MSLKEDITTTVVVHHNNDKEEGSRSETSMTYVSVIADGQRLQRGGVVGGGNSGEAAVDSRGCGGVHRRWLKELAKKSLKSNLTLGKSKEAATLGFSPSPRTLVEERMTECDASQRSTTVGIVDDFGDYSLEVNIVFSKAEAAEPSSPFRWWQQTSITGGPFPPPLCDQSATTKPPSFPFFFFIHCQE